MHHDLDDILVLEIEYVPSFYDRDDVLLWALGNNHLENLQPMHGLKIQCLRQMC